MPNFDYGRLLSTLNNTQLQQKDQPTYAFLFRLLGNIRDAVNTGGSGGGGGSTVINNIFETFITQSLGMDDNSPGDDISIPGPIGLTGPTGPQGPSGSSGTGGGVVFFPEPDSGDLVVFGPSVAVASSPAVSQGITLTRVFINT